MGQDSREALVEAAAHRARAYLEDIRERRVFPERAVLETLPGWNVPFPDEGHAAGSVLEELDAIGRTATVANAGGRYFGFVNGGTVPAALAAGILVTAWDQNVALRAMSPLAAALEEVALHWVCEALGLPPGCGGGVVTGATMASFTALAAARHAVLERAGWDVETDGLFGAPEVKVVVGQEVHASLLKALAMLGLGRGRVVRVPADSQGRMRADALPAMDGLTILCLQAGNVNTGAFDPAAEICPVANTAGAWVHVDGAFGIWAAASPAYRHLTAGYELADSWATDAHKWPNTAYDCGLALVREPRHLKAAMSASAAYFVVGEQREPMVYTPESSRRARGIELWAALRSMGRQGLAELVDRTCRLARRFAAGLSGAGYRILNEVVINQVLVSFGTAEVTESVIRRVQEEGTCWCGGTVWQGQTAMRISVSSWLTTERDIDVSIEVIIQIAEEEHGKRSGTAVSGAVGSR